MVDFHEDAASGPDDLIQTSQERETVSDTIPQPRIGVFGNPEYSDAAFFHLARIIERSSDSGQSD